MFKNKLKKIMTIVVAIVMAAQLTTFMPIANAVTISNSDSEIITVDHKDVENMNKTIESVDANLYEDSITLSSSSGTFTYNFDYTINTPMKDGTGTKGDYNSVSIMFTGGSSTNSALVGKAYDASSNTMSFYLSSASVSTLEDFILEIGKTYNLNFEFHNIGVGTKGTTPPAGQEPYLQLKAVDKETGETTYDGKITDLRNFSDSGNAGISTAFNKVKFGVSPRADATEPASVTIANAKYFAQGPDNIEISAKKVPVVTGTDSETGAVTYEEKNVVFNETINFTVYVAKKGLEIPLTGTVKAGSVDKTSSYDVIYELAEEIDGVEVVDGTLKIKASLESGEHTIPVKVYLKGNADYSGVANIKVNKEEAEPEEVVASAINDLFIQDENGNKSETGEEADGIQNVTVSKKFYATNDLILPESTNSYDIEWEIFEKVDNKWEETDVVDPETGKYTITKGFSNEIKLVATITSKSDDSVSATKTFYCNICNAEKEVEKDLEELEEFIEQYQDEKITSDLDLPTEFDYCSSVTWTSSNPSVITSGGKVTRKDSDKKVTLTATIEKGDESRKRELDVIVKAKKTSSTSGSGGISGSSSHISAIGVVTQVTPTPIPTAAPVEEVKVSFDDLGDVSWAEEAIVSLAERKVVNGKSENTFAPNDEITRAEFAKILINAFGLTTPGATVTALKDVTDSSAWYYESIASAYNKGIITGYADGTFGLNDKVTRQDMAVMIYRAAQAAGRQISILQAETEFADKAEIAEYAAEAVTALQRAGVINGVSATEFAPKATATRAQAAKMIYGLVK